MLPPRTSIQLLILSQLALSGCERGPAAGDEAADGQNPAATVEPSSAPAEATSTTDPVTTASGATNPIPTTSAGNAAAPSASSTTASGPPRPKPGSVPLGGRCWKNADCKTPGLCNPAGAQKITRCLVQPARKLPNVTYGRPLVINGRAQRSPLTDGKQWINRATTNADLGQLTAVEKQAWADRLRQAATEEHASVAAFARTICELLALGAPMDLVARTQAALADEIRHADLCLSWAARLDGVAKQPEGLPAAVAPFVEVDQLAVRLLNDVFWGGCVGETMAAHQVSERAQECPVPELAEDLMSIANDEARHAALAFDSVTWLADGSPRVAELLAKLVVKFRRGDATRQKSLVGPVIESVWPSA